MAVTNFHTKYSTKVIERFYQESLTESAFSKSYDMDFTGVKTVKISSINTVPMNPYSRTGANRYGEPTDLEDTVKEYMMTQDRAFTFIIDKGDNMEQNMIKSAGKAISRQLREVVTPEIDVYRLKVWAENAGQKPGSISAPTKTTIFGQILDGKVALDNKLVPAKNRILFVGSVAYKALLHCEEYIRLNDLGSKSVVNGQVGEILGMKVVFVPDNYLPEGVHFMIVHKGSAISPVKLHEYKVHKDPPGISGHLAEGRFIYDAFVLEEKKDGIYVASTAA